MEYALLEENTIVCIVECEDEKSAEQVGAFPSYPGAMIGDVYEPPTVNSLLAALHKVTEEKDRLSELLIKQEYRLIMLELGIKTGG